jgi:eukaryotic-like serine/threonine-protein kinase
MDNVRELLFGVLAVHVDLIDADQLRKAYHAWEGWRAGSLADVLREWGWIGEADGDEVERLRAWKLAKAGGDEARLLDELAVGPLRRVVERLGWLEPLGARAGDSHAAFHPSLSTVEQMPEADSGGDVGAATAGVGPGGPRERYDRVRLHARGGIGRIWLAIDEDLGRDVAIKELRPEKTTSRTARERLLREARITGQLQHPGIVPVYELIRGEDRGSPSYAMRLVKGRTLSEAVRDFHSKLRGHRAGPLDQHELLNAFVAVCNTVAYAHARGVIHRDLKGPNIVLGNYGEVVLLDWGLAKLVGGCDDDAGSAPVSPDPADVPSPTVVGKALGTPAYMPPEQAAGKLELVDRRSDVYGLGAILYEILAGRPPFASPESNSDEEIRRAREGRPAPPRQVCRSAPPALEAICLKAMAYERDDRYASAAALARDVQSYLADEPVSAYRDPWHARLWRLVRRHRTPVAVAAGLLLATVVALATISVLVGRQKARADMNLWTALKTIDRMYRHFTRDRLARLPQVQAIQLEFYKEASQLYDGLLSGNPENLTIRWHAGRLCRDQGDANRFLGRVAEAERAYGEAIDHFERLARLSDDRGEALGELAGAHGNLGELYRIEGDDARAEEEIGRASRLFDEAIAVGGGSPDLRRHRAALLNSLSVVLLRHDRRDEADRAIRQSVALLRSDRAAARSSVDDRQDLAMALISRGCVEREAGHAKAAEGTFREAIALAERLAAERPDLPDARHLLGMALHHLGLSLIRDSRGEEEAAKHFDRELEIFERLARDYPDAPNYRRELASALCASALILERAGDHLAAEEKIARAETLASRLVRDYPGIPSYRVEWGVALGNLGDLMLDRHATDEARERLEQAVELLQSADPRSPFQRSNYDRLARACDQLGDHLGAARAASRCIPLVLADTRLGRAERLALEDKYARGAIEHLRSAIRAGLQDRGLLEADPALAPLRSRRDYAELIRRLEPGSGRPSSGPP